MDALKGARRGFRALRLPVLLACAFLIVGCGSGDDDDFYWKVEWDSGSAGSDPNQRGGSPLTWNPQQQSVGVFEDRSFVLRAVCFGRPLIDPQGAAQRLVNPASLIEVDPITGLILPGYPRVLFAGDDLDTLYAFELADTSASPYAPRVVPRNAALLAVFSQPVDAGSLNLDADGMLTPESPIIVADRLGRPVPIQATVLGESVILNPVTGDEPGFPASPALFDANGLPAADPEGYLGLVCISKGTGDNVLLSEAGWPLTARADLLGSPLKPAGFNPGNRHLDFIVHDPPFNGFLPDLTPARIIREVRHEGTAGPGSYVSVIVDPAASFNTTANGGSGEWTGALLTVRPGGPDEERAGVLFNTDTVLFLDGVLSVPPAPGVDAYMVQRAEYFEPIAGLDPATAVDPVNHPKDPFDPEDRHNWDLAFFLLFDEWNGSDWVPVDYPYGMYPSNPVEPDWRISLRFSEPMDAGSFRPYETFTICDGTTALEDPCFDAMHLGRVTARSRGTVVSFEPVLEDQFGVLGGDAFRGFGRYAKDLRLVVRSIPPASVLADFYAALGDPGTWPPEVVADLDAEGVLGVTDLGGRTLAFPAQLFDVNDPNCVIFASSPGRGPFPPAVDYTSELSCRPDPNLAETGAVVHRFMGLPHTACDPNTGITGVVFNDHDDHDGTHADNEIYGPRIADIRLGVSGFLSGHPVEFIEHVFDDYNPPGVTSPSYPDPIFKMPFGVGTPVNASYGARFQHIYRRGDCSPDVPTYGGTILDLVGLAWCPVGGQVTSTYIKEMAIAMTLCDLRVDVVGGGGTYYDEPDTRESGGIPAHKESGLKRKFDAYRGIWGPNGPYPAPGNFKEETPPIDGSNVYDADGDGSLRDEWQIVLGDPIDYDDLHSDPVVPYSDGRPYVIDGQNLYAPRNQGAQYNEYLAYPDFDCPAEHPGFGYGSTRGLLIEVRTDDNDGTPVALTNGYSFHIAIMTSILPRFRVFARAEPHLERTKVYAATDPWDEVDPPVDPFGFPNDTWSWNRAWDGMVGMPGSYGDNSRYFMIFDYAKRMSRIESPWLRVHPAGFAAPSYLPPVIAPALDETAPGTALTVLFRAAADGTGLDATGWVPPESIAELNTGAALPFIQFRAVFEADLQTGEVPFLDSIVIPYE